MKQRYFRTTKFNLATFLYVNNQPVAGINQIGPGVKEIAFPITDILEDLIDIYQFASDEDVRLFVSVKKYEKGRAELLEKIKG